MKNQKKPITNPLQTDLERYSASIDKIFTRDNLPAILAVLNSLIPRDRTRILPSEYETIVAAARYDGALKITNDVVDFVATRQTNG